MIIYRSSIRIEDCFKQEIHQALLKNDPYAEILNELDSSETKEVVKMNGKYNKKNELVVIHSKNQSGYVQYWRIVVPDDVKIRSKILSNYHVVSYNAYPRVQYTLNNVRQTLYWKGQTGDVRSSVDNYNICQMEKSDRTLSKDNYKAQPS